MKPAPFDYFAPRTIKEALELLRRHGADARPLAGGQSLVPMLAFRLARPSVLVDLNRIGGLADIRRVDDRIHIGAMARQAHMLASPLLAKDAPLLQQALAHVGHPSTRARGTIGGSIAHADPAAELPVAMIALDATFVIRGQAGERLVDAADFFRGVFETAMRESELLVEIRIPVQRERGSAFVEISRRKGDFAIVSAAACIELDGHGRCKSVRAAVGAIGPVPVRLPEVEAGLIGSRADARTIAGACEKIPPDIFEFDHAGASGEYRRLVTPVLMRRALLSACTRAGRQAA